MASTNLPVQLSSFIGRKRELSELAGLLPTSRLVTLIGAGGCGKTRLALSLANKIGDSFKDGAWLVELASLHDPVLLPQFVTQTLGIPRKPKQPAIESLLDHVHSKEMLLVLDNCEHLIADCARLAQQILSRSPNSRILATSREALAVSGETIFYISGLACPSTDAGRIDSPQGYMQYDAVCLSRGYALSCQISLSRLQTPRESSKFAASWTACPWRLSWPALVPTY